MILVWYTIDTSHFENGSCNIPWSSSIQHPETGEVISRKIDLTLTNDGTWIRGVMTYKITKSDRSETYETCTFEAPLMTIDEYMSLLSESGFTADLYFDYRQHLEPKNKDTMCFVCRKNH